MARYVGVFEELEQKKHYCILGADVRVLQVLPVTYAEIVEVNKGDKGSSASSPLEKVSSNPITNTRSSSPVDKEGKQLILYSGPSCVGKGPLWEQINKRYPGYFQKIILYTSREKGPQETDGVDYNFRTAEEIKALQVKDPENFITMGVHADIQGLDLRDVDKAIRSGKVALAEVSVDWAAELRRKFGSKIYSIFISPFSDEQLEKIGKLTGREPQDIVYEEMLFRQNERNPERPTAIEKRVDRAVKAFKEMQRKGEYDAVIVNDKLHDVSAYQERWDGEEGGALVEQFMSLVKNAISTSKESKSSSSPLILESLLNAKIPEALKQKIASMISPLIAAEQKEAYAFMNYLPDLGIEELLHLSQKAKGNPEEQSEVVKRLTINMKMSIGFSYAGFLLQEIADSRTTGCLGYTQLLYIYGKALGFEVAPVDVKRFWNGEISTHITAMFFLDDNMIVIPELTVDPIQLSTPFKIKDIYNSSGRYLEAKKDMKFTENNHIYRRIRILNFNGILALIFNQLATISAKQTNFDKARILIQKAIEFDEEQDAVYFNAGLISTLSGDLEQAFDYYNLAISKNPENIQAILEKMKVSILLGKVNLVKELLMQAMKIDPKATMKELKELSSSPIARRSSSPVKKRFGNITRQILQMAEMAWNRYGTKWLPGRRREVRGPLAGSTKERDLRVREVSIEERIDAVLKWYELGVTREEIQAKELPGGVPLRKPLLIETPTAKYTLKMAGPTTKQAHFIVSVIHHLMRVGVPAARVIHTKKQEAREIDNYIIQIRDGFYFLEEYIERGEQVDRAKAIPEQFEELGRIIALYHNAMAGFEPEGEKTELPVNAILNYRSEFEELRNRLLEQEEDSTLPPLSRGQRLFLDSYPFLRAQMRRLAENLPRSQYESLPQTIVHGDLGFTNLKFDENNRLVGFFDWDRTRIQPRVEDFKNPIMALGALRGRTYDQESLIALIRGYQQLIKVSLSEEEVIAIWEVLRGTFLWEFASRFLLRMSEVDEKDVYYDQTVELLRLFRQFEAEEDEVISEALAQQPLDTETAELLEQTWAELNHVFQEMLTKEEFKTRLSDPEQPLLGKHPIIFIANRSIYQVVRQAGVVQLIRSPGAVGQSMIEALRSTGGGLVIATAMNPIERLIAQRRLVVTANNNIWVMYIIRGWRGFKARLRHLRGIRELPLHERIFTSQVRDVYKRGYHHVNQRFAQAMMSVIREQPNVRVVIHDYHFFLLALYLRQAGFQGTLQQFIHIPWPPAEYFLRAIPQDIGSELVSSLLELDILSFHVLPYVRAFRQTAKQILGARINKKAGTVTFEGHRTFVVTNPIGADNPAIEQQARQDATLEYAKRLKQKVKREVEGQLEDRILIVGEARDDPTKGLIEGLEAFRRLLYEHPEWRDRVRMLYLIEPSRQTIKVYQDYERQLYGLGRGLNREFTPEVAWDGIVSTKEDFQTYLDREWPLVVIHALPNKPRHEVIGALVAMDIGLINPPKADGMNRVLLNMGIVNNPVVIEEVRQLTGEPFRASVVVASRQVGGYELVRGGVIAVNGGSVDAVKNGLAQAIRMVEREERRSRLRQLVWRNSTWQLAHRMAYLVARNPLAAWTNRLLLDFRLVEPQVYKLIRRHGLQSVRSALHEGRLSKFGLQDGPSTSSSITSVRSSSPVEEQKNRSITMTIDGPSGAGKSSVAQEVSKRLGAVYFSYGKIYRLITWLALEQKINIRKDIDSLLNIARALDSGQFSSKYIEDNLHYFYSERDITDIFHSEDIANNVAFVSSIPEVRKIAVEKLQEMLKDLRKRGISVVLEGRVTGIEIAPDADVKIFLTADLETRAARRAGQLIKEGFVAKDLKRKVIETVRKSIEERDRQDRERKHMPAIIALDAITIDTTNYSVEDTVITVLETIDKFIKEQRSRVFVHTVKELQEIIEKGKLQELIRISESKEERDISKIAKRINDLPPRSIILVTGPSCSGKTTLTNRISESLERYGKELVKFELDRYYKDHTDMPRTRDGKIDFDSPDALDLVLISKNIIAVLGGETIEEPIFDMAKGIRTKESSKLKLEAHQILVIEGIIISHAQITEGIKPERRFAIFVNATPTLRLLTENILLSSDLRLTRRIVRDALFRRIEAIKTIKQWPSVLEGEARYILPQIEEVDLVEDTYLPYELSILRYCALPLLDEAENRSYKESDQRVLQEIIRVKELLRGIPQVSVADIPEGSILREFVGDKCDTSSSPVKDQPVPYRAKPKVIPTQARIHKDIATSKALDNRTHINEVINEGIDIATKQGDYEIARKLEEIRDAIEIRAGPFTYIYSALHNNILYLDEPLLKEENRQQLFTTFIYQAGAILGREANLNEELTKNLISQIYSSNAHPITSSIKARINWELMMMANHLGKTMQDSPFREIEQVAEDALAEIAYLINSNKINTSVQIRSSEDDSEKIPTHTVLRIGIFPIAANPFHWSHLLIGLNAMARFKLDKVVYVVAGIDKRKPILKRTQEHRHAIGKQILNIFSPLFTYSSIAWGTSFNGETNTFRILLLNPGQKMDAYYIVGADHYYRINPKSGQPDTIQKLEDNIEKVIYNYNKLMHKVSAIFIERGKRRYIVETSLEVEFIPTLGLGASSTRIREGDISLMPYTAYAYARKHDLYGLTKVEVFGSSSPLSSMASIIIDKIVPEFQKSLEVKEALGNKGIRLVLMDREAQEILRQEEKRQAVMNELTSISQEISIDVPGEMHLGVFQTKGLTKQGIETFLTADTEGEKVLLIAGNERHKKIFRGYQATKVVFMSTEGFLHMYGGVGRYIQTITPRLAELFGKVIVVSWDPEGQLEGDELPLGEYYQRCKGKEFNRHLSGLRLFGVRKDSVSGYETVRQAIRLALEMTRFLNRAHQDASLIFPQTWYNGGATEELRKTLPDAAIVTTHHSVQPQKLGKIADFGGRKHFGIDGQRWACRFESQYLNPEYVDGIIAITEATKKLIIDLYQYPIRINPAHFEWLAGEDSSDLFKELVRCGYFVQDGHSTKKFRQAIKDYSEWWVRFTEERLKPQGYTQKDGLLSRRVEEGAEGDREDFERLKSEFEKENRRPGLGLSRRFQKYEEDILKLFDYPWHEGFEQLMRVIHHGIPAEPKDIPSEDKEKSFELLQEYLNKNKKQNKGKKKELEQMLEEAKAGDRKLLLYVGRITREKGMKLLFKALGHLDKDNYILVLVGGRPDTPEMEELANKEIPQHKNILWIENLYDQNVINAFRTVSEAILVPSQFEYFGLVLLEAWAAGKPVIVLRNSGGPEEIVKDPKYWPLEQSNGFIADEQTPETLAQAINRALSLNPEDKEMLKHSVRHYVETHHHIRKITAIKTFQFFEERIIERQKSTFEKRKALLAGTKERVIRVISDEFKADFGPIMQTYLLSEGVETISIPAKITPLLPEIEVELPEREWQAEEIYAKAEELYKVQRYLWANNFIDFYNLHCN